MKLKQKSENKTKINEKKKEDNATRNIFGSTAIIVLIRKEENVSEDKKRQIGSINISQDQFISFNSKDLFNPMWL